MTAFLDRCRRVRASGSRGVSLAEFMVAIFIFGILSTVVFATVMGASNAVSNARTANDINAEARLAVNRIARELRQARAIYTVSSPDGATSITFGVDFNGNGVVEDSTSDPEILTYTYSASTKQLLVTANDLAGTAITRPILAGNVSAFAMSYRSSTYQYDCKNTTPQKDGITTWQELDHAFTGCVTNPPGNNNNILDGPELLYIDSVVITTTVLDGNRRQTYRTQVDLRNLERQ